MGDSDLEGLSNAPFSPLAVPGGEMEQSRLKTVGLGKGCQPGGLEALRSSVGQSLVVLPPWAVSGKVYRDGF